MATVRWLMVVGAVLVVAVLLGMGLVELLGAPHRPGVAAWVRVVGFAVAAGGVALAVWTFRHHPPRVMARVTARTMEIALRKLAPDTTAVERLVTTGPYRHVRNPTYLSVFLLFAGLGAGVPFTGLWVAAAVLLVWWNLVVIPPEERELAARFGDAYARYRSRAGRFLPRLR